MIIKHGRDWVFRTQLTLPRQSIICLLQNFTPYGYTIWVLMATYSSSSDQESDML